MTFNISNQYTISDSIFIPAHDADGNQTQIKTTTGEWLVSYNGENRPVKFAQGKREIIMEYDSRGRRFEKKVFKDGHLDAHLKYVYFGFRLIETLDGLKDDRVIQKYIWGLNDELSFVIDNENIYFTHHDANRNVTELTDVSGNLVAHYEYDSLGRLMLSEGNAADKNPFRFSSEYSDSELGLVYYNYRHYNPTDGRWLSRDPVGEGGGYHLYGFLRNTTVNDYDYLGLFGDGQRDPKTGEPKEGNENNPKGHGDLGGLGFDYTREDHGWNSPFNPLKTGNHFQDFKTSFNQVMSSIGDCNSEEFERRMHRLQDYYSHYAKGYRYEPGMGGLKIAGLGIVGIIGGPGGVIGGMIGGGIWSKDQFGHIWDGEEPDDDAVAWEAAERLTRIMESFWSRSCCKKKNGEWVKKEKECKK